MSTPATRVLTVLELLQTHGRMSGAELARRLEVDGRTLRRYIAALEELGIPITAERGRYGGYALVAGFKLPPLMFTNDEALAIALGLLAVRSLGLSGAVPEVESAQAKLERVMPADLKSRVRALSETATLDVPPAVEAANAEALSVLASAARAQRRVRLVYRAADGADSAREFDPYGLVFRGGRWYVAGLCHLRRGVRSFRLDRLHDVRELPASFRRPDDFDAASHIALGIATLPRATAVEVLLCADMDRATEELGKHIGVFEPHEQSVLLRARTDSIDWFARQLARLSFRFEIREPPELRSALRACAERLLQQVR
ncbi:MAG TPA: YafY family protein [Paucimonas sp.]|nr:YafY family protein [Paucimonas sp.]